jgi:hypothetical protein
LIEKDLEIKKPCFRRALLIKVYLHLKEGKGRGETGGRTYGET